jgi:D-beta-D-heptose 7-phosphate kinase/D-beta-D-heptose 1-phosphate adenosyltransferase
LIIQANTDEYYKYCRETRKEYDSILFFNGCFDLIHLGHIKMFKYICSLQFSKVVLGLNSDKSVSMQNKSHKLINSEIYRINMIKELFLHIDIIIFDTPTPCSILWHLMPDLIIKGQDYYDKSFPEKIIMEKIGGEIRYFDSGIDMSTTKIIERIKSNET